MRAYLPWILAVIPGLTFAQDLLGPLETRNHRPLSLPFLRVDPRSRLLESGERSFAFGLTIGNELRSRTLVAEDAETARWLARYRQGLGRNWDLTVDVPLVIRSGGFLDPIVDLWHRYVVGYETRFRPADFGCNIRVKDRNFGAASGIGDLAFYATRRASRDWLVTFGVKLPTGNAAGLIGSGAADAAVGIQRRVPMGRRFDAHLQLGVVAQGRSTELPNPRGLVHQAAVGIAFRASSRDAFLFQIQNENSALNIGEKRSDDNHRLTSLGYRRQVSDGRFVEAFFSENLDWPNWPIQRISGRGPDFTAGLRYVVRW